MTLADLETSSLLVDAARLQANIARMARLAASGGKALRPHVKTHKCPAIARLQLLEGACGITAAKVTEAEKFVPVGANNIFIAHLPVGQRRLERLAALSQRCSLAVAVDSMDVLEPLKDAFCRGRRHARVRIEVDTGHGRTGVRSVEAAADIARRLRGFEWLELEGVFTHEGHVYRLPPDLREQACRDAVAVLLQCRDAAADAYGTELAVVSVGSTPAAAEMARIPEVTELRPGNYVFYDATQVRLGADPAWCALTVMATVVARPSATEAILDAGTKALSGDRDPVFGYGFVLGDPAAVVDWCSEEHGHVDLGRATIRPRIGTTLRIVPAHACTCVNLHSALWVHDGETILARWPVAARDCLV